jgi:galactokinase
LIDLRSLQQLFRGLYASEPRLFSAPGRVNLIGEHTDYNEGFVMPFAINMDTVVAASVRSDRVVTVFSQNVNQSAEFDLDQPPSPKGWSRYVEGVARVLESRGKRLSGANLVLQSDLPFGAGLSSSAALEVSVAIAFLALSGYEMQATDLALAAQEAEHVYGGVNSGIMDHLTALEARRENALLIDCRSLQITYIPLDPAVVVVICDSGVKHVLASSEYNIRRAECETAVRLLAPKIPDLGALRDLTLEDLGRFAHLLPEVIRRRCRHVVTENARTLFAAAALRAGDVSEAGRLMWLSHASLRDDYEVSSPEQNLLVEIASNVDGVLGSRMTGGGFGGCTVTLLRPQALDSLRGAVIKQFGEAFGRLPEVYLTTACDGAHENVSLAG